MLHQIFRPRSIALIGASDRSGSLGKAVMDNLLSMEFKGKVYPVNLRHDEVHGQEAFRHLEDIPEPVDLAIITTAPKTLLGLIDECGAAGVKGVILHTAVSREPGSEGERLFRAIHKKAQGYELRVLGPNSLGFLGMHQGVNASFARQRPRKGNLSVISQSGAILTTLLDMATPQRVGFSYAISLGSAMDISLAELIDFLGSDPRTSCILIYLESLREARKFVSAARAFARSKPIIVLKAGSTEAGAGAAFVHSGARAGDDAAYDAAFRRAGVVRVETLAQLFNCGDALGKQPRPLQNRLAVVTNAGGPAVLAVDHLVRKGGRMATLGESSLQTIQEQLPTAWNRQNPVNLLADARVEDFRTAAEVCLKDKGVDGLLVILTPQAMTRAAEIAQAIVEVSKRTGKPVLASWMGDPEVEEAREVLQKGRVPNYRYPESAVDVFLYLHQYEKRLRLLYETPPSVPEHLEPKQETAAGIIAGVRRKGRAKLNELEAKALLKSYEIPVASSRPVGSAEEAVRAAEELGYPVVLKVLSSELKFKSDVGGVRLNLRDASAVRAAFAGIAEEVARHLPDLQSEGMLIEPMVPRGLELRFAAHKDPVMGPVIAFGQGGLAADVFRDYSIELPPLNMALAHHLIRGSRIYPLLKGHRGEEGADLQQLAVTLYKFAYLLMDFPEIHEISINPFLAHTNGGLGVDAHVELDPEPPPAARSAYDHLIISPYPARYSRKASLRNGQEVLLRPIRPEDEPLEMSMIERLSSQSLYFRFFGQIPKVSHKWLSRFTHIDYDREMAIIAELVEEDQPKMIGVVRIIEDNPGESAEYAITVADPWQGEGLGSLLTDFILEIARDKGLKKIHATVMAANSPMLGLFRKKGFAVRREDFETYYVELKL